ncbi:amidohydrolase family protein, partial [Pseudomonas helleri]
LKRCLDLVTDNSARTLNLGEGYGIAVGRPANLVILDAENDYEVLRRQAKARVSIRAGKVLMNRVPERVELIGA